MHRPGVTSNSLGKNNFFKQPLRLDHFAAIQALEESRARDQRGDVPLDFCSEGKK